jgi:acetyl esterase/lipase
MVTNGAESAVEQIGSVHAGRVDPEFVPLLTQFGLLDRPLFDLTDSASARATMTMLADGGRAAMPHDTGVAVETIDLTRGDGTALSLRIVTPENAGALRGALLWCHGGGYVMGSASDEDPFARELALGLQVAVVAFDYRLAPEHPYPASHDDGAAAWEWVATECASRLVQGAPVLLGGFSAGGGLAAGLALRLRDSGGVAPAALLLDAPMLDDTNLAARAGDDGRSGIWNAEANRLAWEHYLTGRPADQFAAPLRADDLTGLPPTYLAVGGADFFRDEGLSFAAALAKAGNAVELHLYPGGVHGFASLLPDAAISTAARASRDAFLRRIVHSPLP